MVKHRLGFPKCTYGTSQPQIKQYTRVHKTLTHNIATYMGVNAYHVHVRINAKAHAVVFCFQTAF